MDEEGKCEGFRIGRIKNGGEARELRSTNA